MEGMRWSYASGTSNTPLLGETVSSLFNRTALRWPEREALVVCHQGVRWTYADLKQRVDDFAAGLLALGLSRGDRVGIWSTNNAEWVVAQLGVVAAGLILVNINPAYRVSELEYALTKVGCKALILSERFKTSDYVAMVRKLAPEVDTCTPGMLSAARLPELRILILIGPSSVKGYLNFDSVYGSGTEAARDTLRKLSASLHFDDPINIQFTSGTTGSPKAATLTHHNVVNNGYLIGERMRLTQADRLCLPVPLYHCFGMVMGTVCCVARGMALILPNAVFDARLTLQAIQAERCSVVYGVPTMFVAMLENPDFGSFYLRSLRTGIMSGAPCPIEVMRRVLSQMHVKELTIAYGMTETSPVSTQTSSDDSIERRVTSVGRVLPHTEAKIIDQDGCITPIGVPGEYCTRGYLVMRGYWGDDAQTRASIDEAGWMHSGDIATMDSGEYFNIVGRIKDMVIRGGENIYPREIEEFLHQHPKVEATQVFGVPDDRFGEELCAWIKLRAGEQATEEEMRAFCADRIAYMKIPKYIEFVDSFPMTVTGKAQKFLMRERMIEILHLKTQATA